MKYKIQCDNSYIPILSLYNTTKAGKVKMKRIKLSYNDITYEKWYNKLYISKTLTLQNNYNFFKCTN